MFNKKVDPKLENTKITKEQKEFNGSKIDEELNTKKALNYQKPPVVKDRNYSDRKYDKLDTQEQNVNITSPINIITLATEPNNDSKVLKLGFENQQNFLPLEEEVFVEESVTLREQASLSPEEQYKGDIHVLDRYCKNHDQLNEISDNKIIKHYNTVNLDKQIKHEKYSEVQDRLKK